MPVNTIISHAKIITPRQIINNGSVFIADGIITEISPTGLGNESEAANNQNSPITCIDVKGNYLTPGFINLHIHGYGDVDNQSPLDIMDGTESVKKISKLLAMQGITGFLPTTISSHLSHLIEVMENLKTFCNQAHLLEGAQILGIHFESPYITSIGAHLADVVARAKELSWTDLKQEIETLYKASGENIKILTMCPIFKGEKICEIIKDVTSLGIIVSAGHSIANYEQTKAGIQNGIRSATHIFNAMSPLHHRNPGIVGAVLEDNNIFMEIIPDCTVLPHLHPAIIRLLLKIKGYNKTLIITDTSPVADLENGKYTVYGGLEVIKEDDIVYTIIDEGMKRLAGSTLAMNKAIKNMRDIVGVPLKYAIKMATVNPATLLGIANKKGSIAKGMDADLVVFDENLDIKLTMVKGNIVYNKLYEISSIFLGG